MRKLLFHEGEYDGIVLNKVIDGLEGVTLIRAGGKYGLGTFMQGYGTARGVLAADRLMAFRDRDFDYPVPAVESLIVPVQGSSSIRVSYRTTIENYLISPEMLSAFNEEKGLRISDLNSAAQAHELLDAVAQDLVAYTAVRHALGATRKATSLGTTWTSGSGKLPHELTLDFCRREAMVMIEAFQQEAQAVSTSTFEAHLTTFYQWFSAEDFIRQRQYHVYCHGKDLMKRLSQILGSRFSGDSYYRHALSHFDYTQFPDLVQLRSWIAT